MFNTVNVPKLDNDNWICPKTGVLEFRFQIRLYFMFMYSGCVMQPIKILYRAVNKLFHANTVVRRNLNAFGFRTINNGSVVKQFG